MDLAFGGVEVVAVAAVERMLEDLAVGMELAAMEALVDYLVDVGNLIGVDTSVLLGSIALAGDMLNQEAMAFVRPLLSVDLEG